MRWRSATDGRAHETRVVEHPGGRRRRCDGDSPRTGARMKRAWSNILAVAYKEAMAIRHDRPLLGTLIIQPVSFLIILGIAVSFTPRNVPWAVLDWSGSTASRRLVQEIEASGYFLPPVPVTSYDAGRARLQEGRAVAFLVVDR